MDGRGRGNGEREGERERSGSGSFNVERKLAIPLKQLPNEDIPILENKQTKGSLKPFGMIEKRSENIINNG